MLRQLEIPRGVWYWCETWSLTLREERTLRLLESGMLRKIFGPKRDEETGEWRRLHNEELIIRRSNCIIQHLVSSHLSVAVRCTGRPPTECDDTRCCIIQF